MNITYKMFLPILCIASSIRAASQNPHTTSIPLKNFFESVYRCNSWINLNTRSGDGSDLPETPVIRTHVPELLKKIGTRSLLDAGCGEFFWLKEVNLDFLEAYLGIDIVEPMIKHNQHRYGSSKIHFAVADITQDPLPAVDVILCRDVFQHLVDYNVKQAIINIKRSKSRYLLTSTFQKKTINISPITQDAPVQTLLSGAGRNFEIEPFNFPKPLMQIDEGFHGKTLALWEIEKLPDYRDEIARIDRALKNIATLLETT